MSAIPLEYRTAARELFKISALDTVNRDESLAPLRSFHQQAWPNLYFACVRLPNRAAARRRVLKSKTPTTKLPKEVKMPRFKG